MNRLCLLLFAIAFILAAANCPSPSTAAPALAPSSVDCSSLILNMADCLSYVSADENATKPEGTCCSGLKTVLKADAECLCEALKSSAQFGITLNVTKALTLPAACKLSAPSFSTCSLSQSPAAAPVPSVTAGGPTLSPTAGNEPAPVPTPGNSAPAGRSVTFGYVISAIVIPLILTLDKM